MGSYFGPRGRAAVAKPEFEGEVTEQTIKSHARQQMEN
jgi:hypothetical protein